jgi:hypothetical protein
MDSPGLKDAALPKVVSQWARRSPGETATWLSAQPEGPGKSDSMRHLMGTWTASDPETASTWLTRQPAGPSKDEGIVTMATQVFFTDPAAAMAWGATITDSDVRTAKLKQGFDVWTRMDAAAANAWLEGSNLRSDERARLTESSRP